MSRVTRIPVNHGDGSPDDPVRRAREAARHAAAEESAHPASGGAAYDPALADDMPAEVELDAQGGQAACDVSVESRVMSLAQEVEHYKDLAARRQAEFENFRKRLQREKADLVQRAAERVVSELLPALDNLERAIGHVKGGGDAAALLTGVEMTHGQILDVLAKEGVVVIDPAGEPFDPNAHQAVGQREDAELADHTVVDVYQKGYRMGTRVVRPASVVVSVGGPVAPASKTADPPAGGPA